MAFAEEFASGFVKDLPGRSPNDGKWRVPETAVRRAFGRYEKVKLPVLEQLGPDAAVNAAAQMLDELALDLTLPAPGGLIKSSAFSSDGRYYGAGDETILTVWMAPTFDEIAAAEAMEKAKGRQP